MIQFITTALLSIFIHTHHVSVCEIDYNEATQTIEIIQTVFADDLEMAIKKTTDNHSFDINSKDDNINNQIKEFTSKHIKIATDTEVFELQWFGYEIEGNNVKMYIKVEGINTSQLKITNSIFHHLLSGQENIIHFSKGSEKATQICTSKKPTVYFDI